MKQFLIIFFIYPLVLNAKIYTFSGGENNVVHIIASKVLTKAYKKADLEIKPFFTSLTRSLELSNTGEVDGEFARIKKIHTLYPNLLQIPVVITSVEAIAYSKNKNLNIKSWNDLEGHNFTIVKGAKFIEKATKNLKKSHVDSLKEAFNRLNKDKTEIIVIPKKAAIRLILKNEYRSIRPISNALQTLDLYHFVHKKNAHLIPVITPILEQMSNSGEINYISNAYLRSITH